MNRIYYNQADKRWASHPYTSNAHPNATIKSGGCGPTCASMIVSSMVQTIYPNQMGDLFKKNGYRANEGTDPRGFYWVSNTYGIKMTKSVYINDAVKCLRNGGMVIAHLYDGKHSLFSTGGHYIVLADIRGNNIVAYDPYLYSGKFNSGKRKKVKVNGIECIVSVLNFKLYDNYNLYCFEAPKQEKSKYNAGDIVEIDVPITPTGATCSSQMGGDDWLVDDGRGKPYSQFWIHESTIRDNHIVARGVICATSGTEYMIQVFNRQFWVPEKAIKLL